MSVTIARAALQAIQEDCTRRAPKEACGLLLGGMQRIVRAVPAANISADPSRRFDIDPGALFAAHRAARSGGLPIVGCYHSHPGGDAVPSAIDAAQAFDHGWIWLIIGTTGVRAYCVVESGAIHGRFDELYLMVEE